MRAGRALQRYAFAWVLRPSAVRGSSAWDPARFRQRLEAARGTRNCRSEFERAANVMRPRLRPSTRCTAQYWARSIEVIVPRPTLAPMKLGSSPCPSPWGHTTQTSR